jgi:SagB-type dehydrogenase family enzyme
MKVLRKVGLYCLLLYWVGATSAFAQDIKLPAPNLDKPIMQALKNRQSTRKYSSQELSDQTLSELLWAAYGINRPATGGRTAPSAMNARETAIYVLMAKGAYVYDAETQSLKLVTANNLLDLVARQEYVKPAPLHLVYVSDLGKLSRTGEKKELFAMAHTGFISQNVYLYCASEGLGTVVRAGMDVEGLHNALNLGKNQMITLTQTIGYPAK